MGSSLKIKSCPVVFHLPYANPIAIKINVREQPVCDLSAAVTAECQ